MRLFAFLWFSYFYFPFLQCHNLWIPKDLKRIKLQLILGHRWRQQFRLSNFKSCICILHTLHNTFCIEKKIYIFIYCIQIVKRLKFSYRFSMHVVFKYLFKCLYCNATKISVHREQINIFVHETLNFLSASPVCRAAYLPINFVNFENFLSQNCNIFSVSIISKYNPGKTNKFTTSQ